MAIVLGALTVGQPVLAQSAPASFDVLDYTATVRPNIPTKTVAGEVAIHLRVLARELRTLEFDRGDLLVDRVVAQGQALDFDLLPRKVEVDLPASVAAGELLDLSIAYHGAPSSGLLFAPEREQVYTVFTTSQWLVCVDAPGDKATIDLRVVLPAALRAVGTGALVSEESDASGAVVHRWRQETPISTYLFGFAAGRFVESATSGANTVRLLGEGVTPDELGRIFRDTPDMLDFFTRRAGMPYPDATYTQVLVASTVGQEAGGYALLSEEYGRAVLKDPTAVSLIAHELAHQWWGNLVTCIDWTHFWLNEGFATFMAAAYDEHRFGRDTYLQDIERARMRYETVRKAGHDRSLAFPDWRRPTADDRTLVYQKGAYVLHLLREQLGEDAFWSGIRHYTEVHRGGSVTTDDFRRSMEESSGRDLGAFFNTWIYLRQ